MPKTRNTLAILGLWLVVALFVGVALVLPLSAAVRSQQWGTITLIAVCILGAGGWACYQQRRIKTRMGELLREPTAAPLVQWFEASIKGVPEAPCHVAFNTGLVYAYYGEFAQARTRLNNVAWSTKPPYLAGMGALLESLLDYLELHEDERGRERAQQAQRLIETTRGLPGSNLLGRARRSSCSLAQC
jgi:hypothetical protein